MSSLVPRFVLASAAVLLLSLLSLPPSLRSEDQAEPLLPSPRVLAVSLAGLRTLAADYYWIMTTEQIGRARTPEQHRWVALYANQAVTLDPKFLIVYRYAGAILPVLTERNHWVNTTESTDFIRRGLAQFPHEPRLEAMLANNLLFFDRDYGQAGRLLMKLSEAPGAPRHFRLLATRVLAQGGEIDVAWDLARTMRDSAADEETRQQFDLRMRQIEQEQVLREVDAAYRRYVDREGRRPTGMQSLVDAGDLPQLPRDPLEGTIYVDAEGRARATSEWYRLEMYEEHRKDAARRAQGDKDSFVPRLAP